MDELSETELGDVMKHLCVVAEIIDNISEIGLRRIILQYSEPRLYPATFELDPRASRLFEKLRRYEQLDSVSYAMAIWYCDKLFSIESKLARGVCKDAVHALIITLRNRSQNSEQRNDINNISNEIHQMLFDHL